MVDKEHIDLSYVPDWLCRDVAWLGHTDSLLRKTPNSLVLIKDTCRKLFAGEIRFKPEQISYLIEKHRTPLGRYFEALVQTVISLSSQVVRNHTNIIVMDGKRTAGEFDLLYETLDGWIHLELATKFYIGVNEAEDLNQWYGPLARDTLGRKLDKLYNHQLLLPSSDIGEAALTNLGVANVTSEVLILGRLFHPMLNWQNEQFNFPEDIAAGHPKGWWGRLYDITHFTDNPELSWMILEKLDWLSPVPAKDTMDGCKVVKILAEKLSQGPVMVASFFEVQEINRGFLVPDDWKPLL